MAILSEEQCVFQEQEGVMPKAARCIQLARFDHDLSKTVDAVFKAEWDAIEPAFDGWQAPAIAAARTSLAKVAVHFARNGVTDPEDLRVRLHAAMTRSHAALADVHAD
jgi:hypothetical protein